MNQSARYFRLAIALELGLGAVGVVVAEWIGMPLSPRLQVSQPALWYGLAAVLPMLALLVAITCSQWPPLVELRRQVDAMIGELFGQSTLLELAIVALAAGLGEELLFRGALQPLAERWMPPVAALAMVSLLFGLAHAMSATYFVLATLVGVYLGWLAMATGSLVPPIVAHGLYDFIALCFLRSRQGGEEKT